MCFIIATADYFMVQVWLKNKNKKKEGSMSGEKLWKKKHRKEQLATIYVPKHPRFYSLFYRILRHIRPISR